MNVRQKNYRSEYSTDEQNCIEHNFQRLKDIHYLDHAGAAQYADQQMHQIYSNLISNIHCNPHTSKFTGDLIDQVRYKILKSFNTTSDEYSIIFTSGATASLKLVAETFWFDNASTSSFLYLRDNHTSVLGMREIVKTKNICYIERDDFLCGKFHNSSQHNGNSLFVFPAQCNFNGFKYPLDAIHRFQTNSGSTSIEESNRYVCLDAAAFVSTNYLDLNKWQPDFVCISFYKIFGYPTGLGALIVSKRGEQMLNKQYYGGGTVKISLSNGSGWHRKRDMIHERFEDGTLPYLSIVSLLFGFETIEKLIPGQSMKRISQHSFNLAKYLYECLNELRYSNGRNVIHFYHDTDFKSIDNQGGIVNFNVLHEDGRFVGFSQVAYMAQLHNIYLRTGCFCNPGACQRKLRLSDESLKAHFEAGHICGDNNDLIDGIPTGSVRISTGYMTTVKNIDAIVSLIKDCFCNKERGKNLESVSKSISFQNFDLQLKQIMSNETSKNQFKLTNNNNIKPKIQKRKSLTNAIKLHEICVYPIKSCAPIRVDSTWMINRRGLKYDREWMIVRSTGIALTQKSDTKLCLIQPTINESKNTLSLSFPYAKTVEIPLRRDVNDNRVISSFCQSKVCADRIDGIDCGEEVAKWLDDVLCISGLRLIQQNLNDKRMAKNSVSTEQAISLSNQAQFLLINVASVDWLTKKVDDWIELDNVPEKLLQNTVDRFRANLIIESPLPLEEFEWKSIRIGSIKLTTTGPCMRCQMICIDQSTGEKTTEPLQTIAREFNGKMRFGIYLCGEQLSDDDERVISCDDYIEINK
ncbi:molybdenum cofactor sulfurase 3-like [Contarinia nasturtii]|uniref:molybdenum cofactor sulfurase 3-like n=1 Tax=Contarinia nasturtii TaxID=265458 RepID=UPI0012D3F4F7|nr:molybdenum cofactor sulfurase 3-like [Contarinia nasturtii]XP_031627508.1 molybdenum cofactor sulfurase 3-like [Contarinia nasturtii]